MKKYGLICILLALCALLQGCPSPIVWENHPTHQPGSTWETDDGKIRFSVHPNDIMVPEHGTIETENGVEDVVFILSVQVSSISIVKADNYIEDSVEPLVSFARGHGNTNGKNEYVIRITEADEIFEAGEVLVFHKVDQEQEKAD